MSKRSKVKRRNVIIVDDVAVKHEGLAPVNHGGQGHVFPEIDFRVTYIFGRNASDVAVGTAREVARQISVAASDLGEVFAYIFDVKWEGRDFDGFDIYRELVSLDEGAICPPKSDVAFVTWNKGLVKAKERATLFGFSHQQVFSKTDQGQRGLKTFFSIIATNN